MRARAWLAALALAGCAGDPDPCEGRSGTCIAVTVTATAATTVDHLEFDLLYATTHATVTTTGDDGTARALPVVVAIDLAIAAPTRVGLVVAGKHSGAVVGTAAATVDVLVDARAAVTLELRPPVACTAGGFYCGGDMVAGAPDTLYQCNAGGVPLARGVCAAGCEIRPADDDACRAVGGPCTDGGRYCGGDELAGDPGTLYTCQAGLGVAPRQCPSRCVVRPGLDDACE